MYNWNCFQGYFLIRVYTVWTDQYLDVAPLHNEHTASGRDELLEDLREVLRHLKHTTKILSLLIKGTKDPIVNGSVKSGCK